MYHDLLRAAPSNLFLEPLKRLPCSNMVPRDANGDYKFFREAAPDVVETLCLQRGRADLLEINM